MVFQGVHLTFPPSEIFSFPPDRKPLALNSTPRRSTLSAPPFSIPDWLYTSALNVKVPITIATVYAITVVTGNRYNKSKGNKAWSISKTKPFFWFVVLHNVFLAVYSAWTFLGMMGAVKRTVEGWSGPRGVSATVDSLCKIHGPSGLGNAIAYDGSAWVSQSPNILLSSAGTPDATDLGRLWNEGLAFYGWFFYLSKFYEVLDTVIILVKGKRSSTLQTYHHAGAMMCMWAGIRFMSPPIWLFVFLNSFIHALMYTYYTLTAFGVRVPQSIKQCLTTMQISQFLIDTVYASMHSFLSYDIPVQVEVPSIKSAASAVLTTASSIVAQATASAGLGDTLKKILFRAAGEGGVADNVGGAPSPNANLNAHAHAHHFHHNNEQAPVSYRTEYRTVPCIDTQGQTLAIWLNVFYLTPLTYLFVRFFVKSYITRTIGRGAAEKRKAIEGSWKNALRGIDRVINGKASQNGMVVGRLRRRTRT